MPTLNKLEYLDETKQQIKNALNTNFNSQIQDTDTFRSYVTKIKYIYNNWPRVIGEDTTLSLTPTRQGKMQIELKPSELSQNEEPTPENPQDIHVITGDNTLTVSNSNLFDVNKRLTGSINQDGDIYWTARKVPFYEYPFKENTSYTISGYFKTSGAGNGKLSIVYTDGTTDNSSLNTNNATEYIYKKAVTPSNKTIDYIGTTYGSNGTAYIKKDTLMIAEGDVSDYVLYAENKYTINLGDLEYCKIGNYSDIFFKNTTDSEYYDNTLELNKWYLKKNISKITLNGTEDWSKQGNTNFYNLNNVINARILTTYAVGRAICNYFYESPTGNYSNPNRFWINNAGTSIRIGEVLQTTTDDFKTWLSTHNTIIYYQLETPTNILLNETLQAELEQIYNWLLSYQDQTNISQTNYDLPFVINASALMKGDV